MKALLVNTYDRGGAAKACIRLHKGLLKQHIDSKLLLKSKENNIKESFLFKSEKESFPLSKKINKKAFKLLKKIGVYKDLNEQFIKSRDKRLEFFSYPTSKIDITKNANYIHADVINLHWVTSFLNYKTFFQKNNKPVIWTLHDMNPFTGGEHYSELYLGIDDKGFPIKRKITKYEDDKFKTLIELKKKALLNVDNLHLVTLCNWMTSEVKKSQVFNKFPVHHIPNGIDSEVFKPRDIYYSRELLNLPKDKKVILFVSDSVTNNRKGYIYLQRAFQQIEHKDAVLCAVGKTSNLLKVDNQVIELGHIRNEALMSAVYSSADVFVIPSLMDNLPNTVLESLMCNTPVIGFPVGGIPDMVQDNENGFLTSVVSVNSLSETINKFLENSDFFKNKPIRENALKKYNQEIQSKQYIDLFNNIL